MLKTLKRRKKDERIFAFSTAARSGWAVLLVLLQVCRLVRENLTVTAMFIGLLILSIAVFRLSDVRARKTGKILSVELSKLVNK